MFNVEIAFIDAEGIEFVNNTFLRNRFQWDVDEDNINKGKWLKNSGHRLVLETGNGENIHLVIFSEYLDGWWEAAMSCSPNGKPIDVEIKGLNKIVECVLLLLTEDIWYVGNAQFCTMKEYRLINKLLESGIVKCWTSPDVGIEKDSSGYSYST
jgi:hypothetical protein